MTHSGVRPAKVLVIDDDDDIREALSLVLQSHGYDVVEARDGAEGLRALDHGSGVSLVLLDLMMPTVDGIQFMRLLRSGSYPDVRVVVLSGHHAAAQTSAEIGADACLLKPVDLERLLEAVQSFAA